MIIKAIKNLFETQTTLLQKKAENYEVECVIDDEVVDCKEIDKEPNYIGVPAPTYLEDDPWFGTAPIKSDKQIDYMEKETEIKMQEEKFNEEVGQEPEDIHQRMYEIATKNWNTVSETQGGSENFHESPGGWHSGTGYQGQFSK